jgi:D-glycero-alpha-D-manno-heptose 1-phosphate guanylyltransferase
MISEAIVLAGGLGTRLRTEVKDVPKPMAPVNEKPFLFYVMNYLVNEGVERIVLSVGYLSEIIEEYFGDHFRGVEVVYVKEESPLGTGGGVLLAMEAIENEQFFLLNGDTFFDARLESIGALLKQGNCLTAIALKEMTRPDRYGTVELNNQKIEAFNEKQTGLESGIINAGVYAMDKSVFNLFEVGQKFSLETEILEPLSRAGKLGGLVFDGYFIDIGIPEDYHKANAEYDRLAKNG